MKLKERRMLIFSPALAQEYHLGAPAYIRHISHGFLDDSRNTKIRGRSAASFVFSVLHKPLTVEGLGNHGGGGAALVLPGGGQDTGQLVVPGQAVDPALDQNKPELGIPVLPVPLEMLPDRDCLLDQMGAVLGQLWGHALALQNAQDLVASDETDLGNTVGVPEDNTDLGTGKALLGQLEDLVLDLIAGDLQPLRNRPPVGKCRLANALSRCVHPTHTGSLLTSLSCRSESSNKSLVLDL